jgi:hypothetical protein
MTSVIKTEQLARLRALRDTINRQTDHDRAERLRKQREAEVISDYWMAYTQRTTKRAGRGAR